MVRNKHNHVIFIKVICIFLALACMLFLGCTDKPEKQKDYINNISFSPDGKKIIFDRKNKDRPTQIHVYDLEKSELSVFQQPNGEIWSQASYSYDGKYIVFHMIPKKNGYLDLSNIQLAVMDADGKNIRKITNSPGTRIYPSFSHSGRKVIYARAAGIRKSGKTPAAGYDVYEVDLTTGEETRLTHLRFFEMSHPYYFKDDETFVFSAFGSPTRFPGIPDDDHKAIQKKQKEFEARWGKDDNIFVFRLGQQDLPEPYIRMGNDGTDPLVTIDGRIFFMVRPFMMGAGYWSYFEYASGEKHKLVNRLRATSLWSQSISADGKFIGIVFDRKPDRDIRRIIIYHIEKGSSKEIFLPAEPTRIINQIN